MLFYALKKGTLLQTKHEFHLSETIFFVRLIGADVIQGKEAKAPALLRTAHTA